MSIREVSAQEAIYILLRELPLHGKSRTVARVNVLRHNLRCYRVERKGLHTIVRLADVAGPKTRIEPIKSAYMVRPSDTLFNTMSFASFVENFEMVDKVTTTMLNQEYWIRIFGEGFLKKRSKAQVIQMSPWIAPDVANPNF